MLDAEQGFTSDVIKDPERFVGRKQLIRDWIKGLNAPLGLLAVYGKRGVGKSSILRQVQQMALGNYGLAHKAGLSEYVPLHPRTYLTVYYTCDGFIADGTALVNRLCDDRDPEDGLLRLVPEDGKEIVEFSRSREMGLGIDLKVLNWGGKGLESEKYAKVVQADPIQTFRNFISSVVTHQVLSRMKRDGLLILLDEFDVVKDKSALGSLIKSLSSDRVKFAVCGIGSALGDLVQDHASVGRLLEEGAIHVTPMSKEESEQIIRTAEQLYRGSVMFEQEVVEQLVSSADGYPYFVQLLGKECVHQLNEIGGTIVNDAVYARVRNDIASGKAFPTLEQSYRTAIGKSADRELLLHLLAEQPEDEATLGEVSLKDVRRDAQELKIQYMDQLIPRLLDEAFGPVLTRDKDRPGVYQFVDPVFRLFVKLRGFVY